jgi:hypothetical protein
MVPVAPDSPLTNLCRALFRTRGSFYPVPTGVANFELVRADAVVNSDDRIRVFELQQEQQRRRRINGGAASGVEAHNFPPAKLHVLLSLMGFFQERKPDADPRAPHIMYVFHGPNLEDLASVCEKGIETGTGRFGLGRYATLNIEYAAKSARGDYGDLSEAGDRAADGCFPVVMLAASVGMAYPVTPDDDYPVPARADGHSKWIGKGLKPGFDCHIACVSEASGREAVNRKECQYMELVAGEESQLLPVAVLWVREI